MCMYVCAYVYVCVCMCMYVCAEYIPLHSSMIICSAKQFFFLRHETIFYVFSTNFYKKLKLNSVCVCACMCMVALRGFKVHTLAAP